MSAPRVRFAPSPTGSLHIGSARTALFNWLYARRHGGTFILRIDDTDAERSTEESTSSIFESMKWLGLDWDEGPYAQSDRLELYQERARQMIENGAAYFCYCSKEELAAKREAARKEGRPYRYDGTCRNLSDSERKRLDGEGRPKVARLKIEPDESILTPDLILGDVVFDSSTLDDFIFMKPDFTPLYNFSSAVDDADMDITHVIRGQDHLPNTPKQILISKALGMEPPKFAHLPMVHNARGQKLSKRDGAVGTLEFREMGFLPEALVNYLARLAWSAEGEQEIFTTEELKAKFDLDRVGKSPSRFDLKKLTWLNGQYMNEKPLSEKTDGAALFLKKAGYEPENAERLERIVEAVGDRLHTWPDIVTYGSYFFEEDGGYEFDPAAVKKWFRSEAELETVRAAAPLIKSVDPFEVDEIDKRMRAWAEERGEKLIRVLQPLRVAVTGKQVGPSLFETLEILGKESVLNRLKRASEELPAMYAQKG